VGIVLLVGVRRDFDDIVQVLLAHSVEFRQGRY
jgi:hypothetical protein